LFEYWAGDDDIQDVHHQPIISALKHLADAGVKLYIMHGNRDFLISSEFCKATGIRLLQDPSIINLHGKTALLTHGDDLCTDDVEYQKFRLQVRDAKWQVDFLKLPLKVRKDQIETIRTRSEHEKSQKSMQIMDVNQAAINSLLKTFHYPELLIHGHTHRPNQHHIQLDGHNITRWVLGDWFEQGSYLRCNQSGCKAMQL
jgi:UDP-2,3-diacylglucosamine hydrolase